MTKLHDSRVAVFGVGGVGGYTVEALARSGVGALDLIDDDKVCLTNLNRQIIATHKTVGRFKVDVDIFTILLGGFYDSEGRVLRFQPTEAELEAAGETSESDVEE